MIPGGDSKLRREFVRTATFDRSWTVAGLGDEELRELENMLLQNPSAGDVIPHLGGARKIRFALEGRGKSGGARVIYVDVVVKERIYLLLAYPKNVQANLTPEQTRIIRTLIDTLKEE